MDNNDVMSTYELDPSRLLVQYEVSRRLRPTDPDDEFMRITATLVALVWSDEDELIGETQLARARLLMYFPDTTRFPTWEVLDAVDDDIEEFGALLDEDLNLDDTAVGGDGMIDALLIAERVEVDPRWRGRGLGPMLLAQSILDHSAARMVLVALTPAPYQMVDADGAARQKRGGELRVLWARLGAKPVNDVIMAMPTAIEATFDALNSAVDAVLDGPTFWIELEDGDILRRVEKPWVV